MFLGKIECSFIWVDNSVYLILIVKTATIDLFLKLSFYQPVILHSVGSVIFLGLLSEKKALDLINGRTLFDFLLTQSAKNLIVVC